MAENLLNHRSLSDEAYDFHWLAAVRANEGRDLKDASHHLFPHCRRGGGIKAAKRLEAKAGRAQYLSNLSRPKRSSAAATTALVCLPQGSAWMWKLHWEIAGTGLECRLRLD
jgi:hypothetical protein